MPHCVISWEYQQNLRITHTSNKAVVCLRDNLQQASRSVNTDNHHSVPLHKKVHTVVGALRMFPYCMSEEIPLPQTKDGKNVM